MNETACKGFWNHCACADCRKKDRELEQQLNACTPAERAKLVEQEMEDMKRARGITTH